MQRQQCLVGSHHMLAVGNGLENEILGHTVSADQFDNNVDIRIVHQQITVGNHFAVAIDDPARHFHIPVSHHDNLDSTGLPVP